MASTLDRTDGIAGDSTTQLTDVLMFSRRPLREFANGLLIASALAGAAAFAQAPPASIEVKPPAAELTADDVQKALARLDENKELNDAAKAQIRDVYQRTLQELEAIAAADRAIADFEQQISSAPADVREAKADRASIDQAPSLSPPANVSLEQLEKELTKTDESLAALKLKQTDLAATPPRRDARRAEMPKLLAEARDELKQREMELAAAATDDPSMLAAARKAYLQTRIQALNRTLTLLEREKAAYDATDELLQIRQDITAAEVATASQKAQQLRELVNQKRKEEAERQLRQARRSAARDTLQPLAKLAENNEQLAIERRQLADDLATASERLEEVRQTLATVKGQFERTKSKAQAGRLSQAVGQILRDESASLPQVQEYLRNIRLRQTKRLNIEFTKYKHQDRRDELASIPQQTEELARQLKVTGNEDVEDEIRTLLTTERDYLDKLIADYKAYGQMLLQLDESAEELIRTTREYGAFIDERVFWIRSASALSPHDIQPGLDAARWLASPTNWRTLGSELWLDIRQFPSRLAAFLAVVGTLFFFQRKARRQITELGSDAARGSFARFLPTIQTLIRTLYISIPWSVAALFVAWRLVQSYSGSEFVRSFAYAVGVTVGVYLPLELLRQMCRPAGLAEAHFGWSADVVRLIRVKLRSLIVIVEPVVFVAAMLQAQRVEPLWTNSLGRICFLVVMGLAAWLMHQVFRPGGRLMQELVGPREGWLSRLRHVWYLIGVGGPLILAALSAIGFHYTAQVLSFRMLATVYFLIGILLLRAVLMRWVLISRRKLAMEQLRQRRAVLAEMPAPAEGQGASLPTADEPQVDLAAISEQTRQLIDAFLVTGAIVGAWFIWQDVLPALLILDSIPIWPGATTLTYAEVVLAMVVGIVTIMAAKNLPGLLELSVLKYLPIDAGARYASNMLARYAIIFIGLIVASNLLAIDWSKLQWLLAALGVGLGFGLQEIFANFVCGLILLFERPIRVGDIITLDDVTGTVTRIRMRATTITNWDRKELVVPNKDLITGRLLNWTLTNQLNRIIINVGIAYGSNTEKAHKLLLKCAAEHPRVMTDPPPIATFEGFGDSTLNFVLRCFLPDLENRLLTIHELHTRIDQAFRAAEIEIAFPQRDLHIRSIPEGIAKNSPSPGS